MEKDKEIKDTLRQCRKPTGPGGKKIVERMNESHSEVTDWGLRLVSIPKDGILLDAGCGGGYTLEKLAQAAPLGKVFGIDYSEDCIDWANLYNQERIEKGTVQVLQSDVSNTPFPSDYFHLITAIETVYFWPDMIGAFLEMKRILSPGGIFLIINTSYPSEAFKERNAVYEEQGNLVIPSPEQLTEWLKEAGFQRIKIELREEKNWLCCIADRNDGQ